MHDSLDLVNGTVVYRFEGQIIDSATSLGVGSVFVDLMDAESISPDLVAHAKTNALGEFSITIEASYYRSLFLDRQPALAFRLYEDGQFPAPTLHWQPTKTPSHLRITVDTRARRTREEPADMVVRGRVLQPDGTPLVQHVVTAYDQTLRASETGGTPSIVEVQLGAATTDTEGRYRITYRTAQLSRAGSMHADLVIRVRTQGVAETLVAESPPLCHAPTTAFIDLVAGNVALRGKSEYERVLAAVESEINGGSIAAIPDAQIENLACMVEQPQDLVETLVKANRLAAEITIDVVALYGIIRQGCPSTRRQLLALRPASIRNALERSVDANIVRSMSAATIDAVMGQFVDRMVDMAFAPRVAGGGSLGGLLAVALDTQSAQREFVRLVVEHQGTADQFWTTVASQTAFAGPGTVDRLKRTLQWGALSRYHIPLAQELERQFQAAELTSLRDLAKRDAADWRALLDIVVGTAPIGAPPDIPGATESEKRDNYAQILERTVETAFPTAVIANRIERTDGASADAVVFFGNNLAFDFKTTRVAAYLAEHPNAMTGVTSVSATTERLKGLERIFRLTPRYVEMKPLLDAGLNSSQSIHNMGRQRFLQRFAGALGAQRAEQVYGRACWVASAATALHAKFGAQLNNLPVYVLPDLATQAENPHAKAADWATLFGSPDACACEHCRSVYSPAAYLVDLLEFLDRHDSTAETADSTPANRKYFTLRDILIGDLQNRPNAPIARRPDIARIQLSCKNTNTALPYIDLVNEILEVVVANIAEDPDYPWTDPIYSTGTADELLAEPEIIHPGAHHGAYVELDAAVHPFDLPWNFWADEARTYLAHLGVLRHELLETFIALTYPVPAEVADKVARERLRLPCHAWEIITGQPVLSFTIADYWGMTGANWIANLAPVPRFLKQSGLTFDELRELLDTAYVGGAITLNPQEGCDIDAKQLVGLTEANLGRLHRFLRLRLRAGFSITDMDRITSAFGMTDINDVLVRHVADILALKERLNLPLPVLLSFWGNIGTKSSEEWGKSLYEELFLNRAVTTQSGEFANVPTNSATGTVLDHGAGILAALRISAVEFALLTSTEVAQAVMGLGRVIAADAALDIGNLSRLHRIVALARALGLTLPEFLVLRSLSGINTLAGDELSAAAPAQTRIFVELVNKVRASALSVTELHYLARHVLPPGTTLGMTEKTAVKLVAELEAIAIGVNAEVNALTEPTGSELEELRRTRLDNAIHHKLAGVWTVDVTVIEYIFAHILKSPLPAPHSAIEDFYDVPNLNTADQRKTTLLRFDKLALLMQRLGFGRTEFELTYPANAPTDWTDLNDIPLGRLDDATDYRAQFQRLVRFIDLATLRDVMPDKAETLRGIGEAINKMLANQMTEAQFFDEFAKLTGWPRDDIEYLITHNFGYPGLPPAQCDCLEERSILCLYRAVQVLKRLGASAERVHSWSNIDAACPQAPQQDPVPSNVADIALDIKRVARAKYDLDQWSSVARPLRDVLREKQRDALVHYLVAKQDLDGSNALFEKLLIDVEMSACQLTSRIKQAISSVQTFAQRILLGLEATIGTLGEDAAHEWSWMKNYRVWEANRKIFLYPENWIEPELRDDKTPFFRTLESRLLQGEITAEAVETAYLEYLEQLHEVARLEVAAIYHEVDATADDPVDIVHVIARTQAAPHRYHYRQRINGSYWTPWEKVDVDIQGDHLLATVWNRRLYLFWPVLGSVTETANGATAGLQSVDLAWTSRHADGFSEVRVSKDSPVVTGADVDSRWISLMLESSDSNLTIVALMSLFGAARVDDTNRAAYLVAGRYVLSPCTGKVEIQALENTTTLGWAPYTAAPERFGFVEFTDEEKNSAITNLPGHDELSVPVHVEPDKWGTPVFATLLSKTPANPAGRYSLVVERSVSDVMLPITLRPIFLYSDPKRAFFVKLHPNLLIVWIDPAQVLPNLPAPVNNDASSDIELVVVNWSMDLKLDMPPVYPMDGAYRFQTFYHPYVCDYTRTLARDGIDGLLRWSLQGATPLQTVVHDEFATQYVPDANNVGKPYPIENVDFSFGGAYSQYNWELFFHAPFLIATRLTQNSRFEDADRWYRYIFDPTGGAPGNGPERFWYVRPFRENLDLASIQSQLEQLALENPEAKVIEELLGAEFDSPITQDLAAQIAAWREKPFNPHLIARMRPLAYQKSVVMKYVDNLLQWGDSLFRRETIESINEATQLYILAQNILGKRPRIVKTTDVAPKTYAQLEPTIDAFSNALVEIESIVPPAPDPNVRCTRREPPPVMRLYFCVPPNDKMLGLWDTVEDRLWKIRHCMDIEGNVRQLPLFEPPIDPALLVRATAAGVDAGELLLETTAPLPLYRFSVLLPKAVEFTNSVIALGNTLLSILEKRDGEKLAKLRATQEVALLTSIRNVRQRQVDEARATLDGLRRSRSVIEERLAYYSGIEYTIGEEREQEALSALAMLHTGLSGAANTLAGALKLIPQIAATVSVPPAVTTEFGGDQLAGTLEIGAQATAMLASLFGAQASMAGTQGAYQRRWAEWKLQERLAERELAQIDRQILAAEIRLDIANKELKNHDLSLKNATEVEAHLRTKFTNEDIYVWMLEQVKGVYFQGYKLAYDLAKRAERAFQFELASSTSFVGAAYWNSTQQGLMAGERLQHDLRRMDAAYLEQNKREYEITKHVSLAEVDPKELIKLRETGECTVTLQESLFDQDWPGHYLRRIKTVSVTVPVTNAPFGSVNCKLALQSSQVKPTATDPLMVADYRPIQSIVTSTGQQDSGMFELLFRDERYLPFEGAGAIGTWNITLKKEGNRFNPTTAHDVVMHLRYSAREAENNAAAPPTGVVGHRLFSARTDFPDAWEIFTNPAGNATHTTLSLPLAQRHFQPLVGKTALRITAARIFAKRRNKGTGTLTITVVKPDGNPGTNVDLTKDTPTPTYGEAMVHNENDLDTIVVDILDDFSNNVPPWQFTIPVAEVALDDIWLVCDYVGI